MATTRRTKRPRSVKYKITPEAGQLFRQMRKLPHCTCVWGPRYYDTVDCASCDEWWRLQNQLHNMLDLPVNAYPAVAPPPSTPPYAEIAGGRVHHRNMSHAGGPEDWDRNAELFDALMREAYGEQPSSGLITGRSASG
jgi:hypothetical protein